jgi:PcfJ-like protein
MTESKPVELLRDRQGIYGIGVSDAYDIEALAWACGADPEDARQTRPSNVILRPDMLQFGKQWRYGSLFAVLQKITGGFRHGMFAHSHEERLRQVIHHETLIRAGLPWPPPNDRKRWWSSDKTQQDRNRRIYHGLRLQSLHVVNKLIGIALQEAADQRVLKIARRFAIRYREPIYRAGAKSRRALQLAEAFPVLALAVYGDMVFYWNKCDASSSLWETEVRENARRVQEAADLIERGARLREVAAVMRIPMALRRVKPGAAHLAVACHNAEWVTSRMPDSLPRMRTWLRAVHHAHIEAGPDFAEWAAAHALQIPVGSENELASFLNDTADWVRASHGNDGHQFVVRPFTPTMSLRTVTKLSAEWHEAVASNLTGPQHTFPAPWLPAATINGVEIIPIDNSADLYREGAFMHHCIGTYSEGMRGGHYYVYSIRRNGERVATAGLVLHGARAELHQLRGPCNAPAPKQITATVERWLRAQAPVREQWPSREAASRAAGAQDSADDSDRRMQTIEEEAREWML